MAKETDLYGKRDLLASGYLGLLVLAGLFCRIIGLF